MATTTPTIHEQARDYAEAILSDLRDARYRLGDYSEVEHEDERDDLVREGVLDVWTTVHARWDTSRVVSVTFLLATGGPHVELTYDGRDWTLTYSWSGTAEVRFYGEDEELLDLFYLGDAEMLADHSGGW